MEQAKLLTKFDLLECPHCKKTFHARFQTMIPAIINVITDEQIAEAKEKIQKGVEEIKFADKKDKKEFLTWLKDASIDLSDVDPVLKQIATNQLEKISSLKKDEQKTSN